MRAPSYQFSVEVMLSGELDRRSAAEIQVELLALASATHADELVVDMSGAAFVDAAGLKPLAETQRLLNRRGKRLRLRGVSRASAHLIRAAGLAGSLHVLDIATSDVPRPVPAVPVQRVTWERG